VLRVSIIGAARDIAMKWSLSEFLNLIELRGQCWAFVDIATSGGFSMPHSDAVVFYAVVEGSVKFSCASAEPSDVSADEIIMVLSGDAHALRGESSGATKVFDFLHDGEYVDAPPSVTFGCGHPLSRVICGRLKVRWPSGKRSPIMPPILRLHGAQGGMDVGALERAAQGSGGTAVLTRASMLALTVALRDHPDCKQIFNHSSSYDRIARAVQFIETHPFRNWTVESLAKKVGMGRSNLAARFVSELGKTPNAVLTEERMKHAALFLERSDLKISEISARIGYRSEAAFSRRFTSYFGVSPGKMRKRATTMLKRPDSEA
jgi:AraC-like DNA-binding protein/mannose-6-phosphate isomerase-like protein (cupin superfamily)